MRGAIGQPRCHHCRTPGAVLQDQLAKREASGRVAQIFDVGEREGYFYIAMEYIEGEDLSELVARGPSTPTAPWESLSTSWTCW